MSQKSFQAPKVLSFSATLRLGSHPSLAFPRSSKGDLHCQNYFPLFGWDVKLRSNLSASLRELRSIQKSHGNIQEGLALAELSLHCPYPPSCTHIFGEISCVPSCAWAISRYIIVATLTSLLNPQGCLQYLAAATKIHTHMSGLWTGGEQTAAFPSFPF